MFESTIMILDVGLILELIAGFVFLILIYAFFISCHRLDITGAAKRSIMIEALLTFAIWLGVILYLGQNDRLSNFESFPAPFLGFFILMILFGFYLAFSKLGLVLVKGLSYAELIGLHSFRILVEIALICGAKEGLTPKVMTAEGLNFDFITGLGAVVLYFYLSPFSNIKSNVKYIKTWNCAGLVFLGIVLSLGFFAFPAAWRIFMDEPSNIWVTHTPYILLPGFLVETAFILHLMIFRKLNLDPKLNVLN